jgi:hypothetical protein
MQENHEILEEIAATTRAIHKELSGMTWGLAIVVGIVLWHFW